MPPRKRSTVIVDETFQSDLDSDSDDDDRVCLDIGKQAARDMLSDRTRESYSASMRRMISWKPWWETLQILTTMNTN